MKKLDMLIKLKKENNGKTKKKGISLIVLAITIVVSLILLSAVIIATRSSINNARLTAFANNIIQVEDSVKSYYVDNNTFPTFIDKTEAVSLSEVESLVNSSYLATFREELALNYDSTADSFYYIDLSKLDFDKTSDGLRKNGETDNDVYVISYPNMNAYYLKGISVEGDRYFSLTNRITDITKVNKTEEEVDNSTTSVTETDGIKITRTTDNWTNKLPLTVSTNLSSGQSLYISLSGNEKLLTSTAGSYTSTFNVSDKYTTAEITNSIDNQYVEIIKKSGSNIVGKNRISNTKLETQIPTLTNITTTNYNSLNTVTFNVSDDISKIKEVRYDYLAKVDEDGNVKDYYTGITNFDESYIKQKGKKASISNENEKISLKIPSNVTKIQVYVFDNAGNWFSQQITLGSMFYIGEVTNDANSSSLKVTANVYSTLGVSSMKVSVSSDAKNYSNESTYSFNTTSGKTSQEVTFTGQNYTKAYVKIVVTDNNSNVSKRVTITRIIPIDVTVKPAVQYVANKPKLANGMTAVKWNSSNLTWDAVANPDADTSWYDYANKQWANAMTADGSMWVWIPRYAYKIDSSHTSTAQSINILFLNGTDSTVPSDYIVHPSFTFGTTEITGIWVAKFAASGDITDIDIVPEATVLKDSNLGKYDAEFLNTVFNACRSMETNSKYGWGVTGNGIDTHLMKNIDWGAALYLSHSIYGKNSEIWVNPDSDRRTGRAGSTSNEGVTVYTYPYYDTTYGINASTTGNIYGIYDMSGLASEIVAAYYDISEEYQNGYLRTTFLEPAQSILQADSKYKDVYKCPYPIYGQITDALVYEVNKDKKGDAMYETSTSYTEYTSWYNNQSDYFRPSRQFIYRGSTYTFSSIAMSGFTFSSASPNTADFRPVLIVEPGV